MKFTKMHGIGNDYVYVDCTREEIPDPAGVSRFVSDRHKGIGSDGLILIKKSSVADFKMEMYNADGSQGKMCGNGIRCVAKYVYDNGLTDKREITVETLSGIKTLALTVEEGSVTRVRVNMGEPILKPADIPVKVEGDRLVNAPIEVVGHTYFITCVSMGNPHAVLFMEDVEHLNIEEKGPLFECHDRFPDRVNTEFVQILDRRHLRMRVWERGSGETMACGTGACAVLVAAVLNGYAERRATVHLLGGDLEIFWDQADNCVYMTGPAATVFTGEIDL